jgi:hypothetical protein
MMRRTWVSQVAFADQFEAFMKTKTVIGSSGKR